MRIISSKRTELEEALFHYLVAVRDGQPRAARPLVTGPNTLHDLYADPAPDLREALRHCLDAFLVELGPDPGAWGAVNVPVETLGVALAALNCLSGGAEEHGSGGAEEQGSEGAGEQKGRDPVSEFTTALIASLPPARERDAALAYHAVLRGLPGVLSAPGPDSRSQSAHSHPQPAQDPRPPSQPAQSHRPQHQIARRPRPRGRLFHALVERSPLTALWALDAHTPSALEPLAAELLPGWKTDHRPADVWSNSEDWLETVTALLDDEQIARWARHRWLALPETGRACRNTGLLLEALRRRGDHRDLLLTFYEAYDYFRAQMCAVEGDGTVRAWPIVPRMEKLLTVAGDGDLMAEAALRVNRRGNEYFLKFRPLLKIVVEGEGSHLDYAQLSREFIWALQALVPYTTEAARQKMSFEEIEFEEDDA
jgi:hypothetical protein